MYLKKNRRNPFRVVIVGAGIVGSSVGFFLSRQGIEVTIIEADFPCSGASSHSFAYLNAFDKPPDHYFSLSRRSMELWDRMSRLLGCDIGLRWTGMLKWVNTDGEADRLRELVYKYQELGYHTRLVNTTELTRIEPHLQAGPVTAAAFNETEGQVEPSLVVNACIEHIQHKQGSLITQTAVTGLELDNSNERVTAVCTDSGRFECDAVVVASGAKTAEVAAMANVSIHQEPSPGVVIKTDLCTPTVNSVIYAPAIDDCRPQIHIRQTAHGHLMIGEGTQESESQDDSIEHASDLLDRAIHYFPALESATASTIPVGYRPMPADGLPIIGFTNQVPNMYLTFMHSGVTLAAIVGELAAIEIADNVLITELEPYRLERLHKDL